MSFRGKQSDPPPPYTIVDVNKTENSTPPLEQGEQYFAEENEENEENDDEFNATQALSLRTKLAYASVGLPYSMQLSVIAFYINYFLLDVAKVSPTYNAIILFTSRVIDGLTDPIGGYIFSRFSTRWGKMKPWILFSSPLVAICYLCVWVIPDTSEAGKFVYYLIFHSLLWTFMTASRIPHTALTVYVSLDQRQRDFLTQFRTLFEAGGLLFSIVFHGSILALFNAGQKNVCTGGSNSSNMTNVMNISSNESEFTTTIPPNIEIIGSNVKNAYITSAAIIAALCIGTAIFLFLCVQEVVDVISTKESSFLKSLGSVIRYKPFIILTGATVGSVLATQSIQSVLELYLRHVKKNHSIFPFLAGTLIVSTMICLPLWTRIMAKIGKKRSFLIGNLCLLPTLITVFISASPMPVLFVAAILGANTVACGYLMPWAMLPECIDSFMLKTGKKPVEAFYTFFFLGAKFAQALYSGIVQLSLGASGFDSKICEQPESVSTTLRILIGIIPGVILILSTICLCFYSINDQRAKEIQTELKELRLSSARIRPLSAETLEDDLSDETTSF